MRQIPQSALDAVFEKVGEEFTIILEKPVRLSRIDHVALAAWSETWKPNSDRQPTAQWRLGLD